MEELPRPRETVRMASVRPMASQYDIPREQISRVQSVRPDQDRIIDLSARREMMPHSMRQVSVRPEQSYTGQAWPVEERLRYEYAPETERRYFTDGVYDDRVDFEKPRDPARRILQ